MAVKGLGRFPIHLSRDSEVEEVLLACPLLFPLVTTLSTGSSVLLKLVLNLNFLEGKLKLLIHES